MSCPHGLHSQPETCSQCVGATPRVVEQVDSDVAIDGRIVRSFEPPPWAPGVEARRRGGRHLRRRPR